MFEPRIGFQEFQRFFMVFLNICGKLEGMCSGLNLGPEGLWSLRYGGVGLIELCV